MFDTVLNMRQYVFQFKALIPEEEKSFKKQSTQWWIK